MPGRGRDLNRRLPEPADVYADQPHRKQSGCFNDLSQGIELLAYICVRAEPAAGRPPRAEPPVPGPAMKGCEEIPVARSPTKKSDPKRYFLHRTEPRKTPAAAGWHAGSRISPERRHGHRESDRRSRHSTTLSNKKSAAYGALDYRYAHGRRLLVVIEIFFIVIIVVEVIVCVFEFFFLLFVLLIIVFFLVLLVQVFFLLFVAGFLFLLLLVIIFIVV